MIRTNVSEDELGAEEVVRAHVFLCMLARYVRWHMERALAPLLLTDHDPEGGEARVEGTFDKYLRPTPLKEKAFELLDVSFRM